MIISNICLLLALRRRINIYGLIILYCSYTGDFVISAHRVCFLRHWNGIMYLVYMMLRSLSLSLQMNFVCIAILSNKTKLHPKVVKNRSMHCSYHIHPLQRSCKSSPTRGNNHSQKYWFHQN